MRPGSSISAGLSDSVNGGSDRVVATGGLAQGTASGVGSARVQQARLAGNTRYGFAGAHPAQPRADWVNTLFTLLGAVVRVEPPQPSVVNLSGAELEKPRVGRPRALAVVHLEQALLDARVDTLA